MFTPTTNIKRQPDCTSSILYEDEKQRLVMYERPNQALAVFELQTPIGNGAYHTENQLEVVRTTNSSKAFTPMLLGLVVQQASAKQ